MDTTEDTTEDTKKPFRVDREYYLYTFGRDMIDWQKLPTITTYIQDHIMNWEDQNANILTLNESVLATHDLTTKVKDIWVIAKGLIDSVDDESFFAPRILIIKAGNGYIWMSKDLKRGILASPRVAREGSTEEYIGHITFRKSADKLP